MFTPALQCASALMFVTLRSVVLAIEEEEEEEEGEGEESRKNLQVSIGVTNKLPVLKYIVLRIMLIERIRISY